MPNQSDYDDNDVMINPYFMNEEDKAIYYAGYREGRESLVHEEEFLKQFPDKNIREGVKKEYLKNNILGPTAKELRAKYKH